MIAAAVQGSVGFLGDAWVHPRYQGGTQFSRDWIHYAPLIVCLVGMGTRGARGYFLFSRQRVMEKINPPIETCMLGAEWGGEERYFAWSSEAFIRQQVEASFLDPA